MSEVEDKVCIMGTKRNREREGKLKEYKGEDKVCIMGN